MKISSKFPASPAGGKVQSSKSIEGVKVKKLIRHNDERGFFEELIKVNDDFFKEGFGQLSHSYMKKGVIKAWHIHKTQIDWWFVSRGTLHVALYDNRKDSPTYKVLNQYKLGEEGKKVILRIPAGVAHGCKVKSFDAELFYITSNVYSTEEEGRIDHNDPKIGYDWINI